MIMTMNGKAVPNVATAIQIVGNRPVLMIFATAVRFHVCMVTMHGCGVAFVASDLGGQ